MFYQYRQNNSGGSFRGDTVVIVEADSPDEADDIAQRHGVYFDGCSIGSDCSCCGDRWYRASSYDAHEEPSYYGTPLVGTEDEIIERDPKSFQYLWSNESIACYYKDGSVTRWKFTEQHIAKIKSLILAKRDVLYGFRIAANPLYVPSSVMKYYMHEDIKEWYAEDGNNSILGEGWIKDTNPYRKMITFGAATEAEAIAALASVKDVLELAELAAVDAATNAIQETFSGPASIKNLLKSLFAIETISEEEIEV